MSKTTKTDINKKALVEALQQSLGVVTTACKKVGIHRSTFYDWMNDDEDFAAEVRDVENIALDFAESNLYKKIREGDTSSIIFYLKTKGKKRGYIERIISDVNMSGEMTLKAKPDLSNLTDEELRQLAEIQNKLEGDQGGTGAA